MQVVRASHKNHDIRESNSDVGNALATSHHALPLKTPARTAIFNNTLLRTNLKENALRTTATLGKTVHATTAGLKHHVFHPNTPGLKQAHVGKGHLLLKDNPAASVTFATNTSVMPPLLDLTNKTPFTTRFPHDSPGDTKSTPLKMPFLAPSSPIVLGLDASPETIIRPSRSRFSLRSPRPSSQIKLGQRSNDDSSFKTPDPLGRRKQWDISHGDISISVTGPDVEVDSISECDDEIEYMPPPVAELPYDPGFPMPDYQELGAELWKLSNVLDLNTLLPYDPPTHLQKFEFESDNVVVDAVASLALSLEALRGTFCQNSQRQRTMMMIHSWRYQRPTMRNLRDRRSPLGQPNSLQVPPSRCGCRQLALLPVLPRARAMIPNLASHPALLALFLELGLVLLLDLDPTHPMPKSCRSPAPCVPPR
ncbi:hypothetical protein BS47DRAFT_84523 [Hydnum rufescens UP504]|uniref:Uncharacterized protein n=1 Tax=Hydnum rufescens UP504 TaxID=1448309 RepID=A0A9P6B7L0_9AGAM|nr:hypothetical protein BS47DRAFT_84523 [Hydnum rufescens UP504]